MFASAEVTTGEALINNNITVPILSKICGKHQLLRWILKNPSKVPFRVEYVTRIAQQDSGSLNCGVFVAVYVST
ncbi:hypothetical protein P3S68_004052 [Capsicum galapagoense]